MVGGRTHMPPSPYRALLDNQLFQRFAMTGYSNDFVTKTFVMLIRLSIMIDWARAEKEGRAS